MKNRRKNTINITLSIDKNAYLKFSEICREKGLIRSIVIENIMKNITK